MLQRELIETLTNKVKRHLEFAQSLKDTSDSKLDQRPSPEKWSVLECLEHLSLYADYYHPEFEKRIKNKEGDYSNVKFKPGILGNYFAKSMVPSEDMKTMKTFKDKDPENTGLPPDSLLRFIEQQKSLLELLGACDSVNLNGHRIPITIAKFIRLKLGDTLHFIVNHNERHVIQAQNVLKGLSN